MSFTYALHVRPLRICIRIPSSAPIDRSFGGFWDSANPSSNFYPIIQFLSHHPILGHYELIKQMKKNTPCSQGNASRCCGSVMRSVISPYGLGKHWWLVLCQYLGFLQKSPGNLPWVGMIHHGHIPWCVHSLCENLIHIACFVIFIIPKSRPFAG